MEPIRLTQSDCCCVNIFHHTFDITNKKNFLQEFYALEMKHDFWFFRPRLHWANKRFIRKCSSDWFQQTNLKQKRDEYLLILFAFLFFSDDSRFDPFFCCCWTFKVKFILFQRGVKITLDSLYVLINIYHIWISKHPHARYLHCSGLDVVILSFLRQQQNEFFCLMEGKKAQHWTFWVPWVNEGWNLWSNFMATLEIS